MILSKPYSSLVYLWLTLFFLPVTTVWAQSWQWGISGGSFSKVNPKEMVTSAVADTSGNVYLLSSAGSHNLQVDGHPLQGVGREDYLIGSFNCKGDYRWSVLIGGRNGDRLDRLQTDAEGNIYVSGYLTRSDSAYFKNDTGNDTVLPFSRFDQNTHKQTLFLAKYSASGALQWLRMPHSDTVNFIDANRQLTLRVYLCLF